MKGISREFLMLFYDEAVIQAQVWLEENPMQADFTYNLAADSYLVLWQAQTPASESDITS